MKGVYFLLNKEEIVYIGKSLYNMKSRVNQHIDERKKIFTKVKYHHIENDSDIHILEVAMISKHKPIYNIDCVEETVSTIDICIEKYTTNIDEQVIIKKIKKSYIPHIKIGNSIDLLKEMVSLSKPAQNTIIWLKDNLYWENETGEVKIEMKNFTNSEQQQFQKGFKELKSKNLMRRTKRSHYMMNPNALIPLNYDKAIVLWRSLEILEKKEK